MLRSLYLLSQRLLRFKKSRRLEEVSGAVSTPFGMLRAQPPMQTNKISEGVPQEASVASVGAKEATTTTMGAASTVGSKATCLGNALSRRRREASVEASEGAVEEPEMALETWAGVQGPRSTTTIGRVRKEARLDGAALFSRAHLSLRHQHGVLRLTHP